MSIINACGNFKRDRPDMDESLLVIKAISDVNIPKFTTQDVFLFKDIIKDLFPGKELPSSIFERLDRGLKAVA